MGKILAIDYGRKRIGLALSDEDEFLAFAINNVTAQHQAKLFSLLLKRIIELNPTELLVGHPLGIDLKPTQMSLEVEEFIKKLEEQFKSLKITKWNEVGTSKMAQSNQRHKSNKNIDSESARIILQEYLDFKKRK